MKGAAKTMIAIGLALLAFIGFELYASRISEARDQEQLRDRFKEQLFVGRTRTALPATGDAVALIEIPDLNVAKVVVEGSTSSELQQGPGHFRSSPMPGQPGNAVIAGHRSVYGAPFAGLPTLDEGAEIFVTTLQGRFEYEVESVGTVDPGEPDVIGPTTDNRLTLVTSHPAYLSTGRLAVTAALQDDPVAPPSGRLGLVAVDEQETGLTGDRDAIAAVGLYALLLAASIAVAWTLFKRWSRWATYLLVTPIWAALLFLTFDNLNKLLPATL